MKKVYVLMPGEYRYEMPIVAFENKEDAVRLVERLNWIDKISQKARCKYKDNYDRVFEIDARLHRDMDNRYGSICSRSYVKCIEFKESTQ